MLFRVSAEIITLAYTLSCLVGFYLPCTISLPRCVSLLLAGVPIHSFISTCSLFVLPSTSGDAQNQYEPSNCTGSRSDQELGKVTTAGIRITISHASQSLKEALHYVLGGASFQIHFRNEWRTLCPPLIFSWHVPRDQCKLTGTLTGVCRSWDTATKATSKQAVTAEAGKPTTCTPPDCEACNDHSEALGYGNNAPSGNQNTLIHNGGKYSSTPSKPSQTVTVYQVKRTSPPPVIEKGGKEETLNNDSWKGRQIKRYFDDKIVLMFLSQ